MERIYSSAEQLVGNTPLLHLQKIEKEYEKQVIDRSLFYIVQHYFTVAK